jgi:hypothetical protein
MKAKILFRAFVLFIATTLNVVQADYLPENTYYEKGNHKRVLNIQKAPFFAKGDGKTDDTKAFVQAFDFILDEIDKNGWTNGKPSSPSSSYIIYVPNGTYLISDTIVYSGNVRLYDLKKNKLNDRLNSKTTGVAEAVVWIRIQGENKNKTIIKLKDKADGFNEANPKPVISFGKGQFNNLVSRNKISDLTIRIGKGNPNAVGLLFAGANNAFMSELNIVSEDSGGNSGILLPIPPTMGWHNNISIDGFDYGVRLSAYHASHNSFEDVSLINQNKAGVYLESGSASFENLSVRSSKKSVAIIQNKIQSLMTISNSKLVCNNNCRVGINSAYGQMLIKNTNIEGYRIPMQTRHAKSKSTHISTMTINDSGEIQKEEEILPNIIGRLSPEVFQSMNKNDWISPDAFSSTKKDISYNGKHLQRAMNSGKPIVYLPLSKYVIDSPVNIPCSVKRVAGLYTTISTSKKFTGDVAFVVSEECKEPLTIEELHYDGVGAFIGHESQRTLNLKALTTYQRIYDNLNSGIRKDLFLSNVNGWGKSKRSCVNEDVWARFVNTESAGKYNFYLDNCRLWLFGFKTEKVNTKFFLRNKSELKILGGVINQFDKTKSKKAISDIPMIDSIDSNFSVSLVSTGRKKMTEGFKTFAKVENGKKKYRVPWDGLPAREKAWRQIMVPLYQNRTSYSD